MWENNDIKREFIVGVVWRTLVVYFRVIKLTFQMKYYSAELGYIAYGVMTFHRTQRPTNTSVSVSVVTYWRTNTLKF